MEDELELALHQPGRRLPIVIGALALLIGIIVVASVLYMSGPMKEDVPLAETPAGFALLEGGTTGGDPAHVCRVAGASEQALREAVACTQTRAEGGVVVFAPGTTVKIESEIPLPSNITIQGPVVIESSAKVTFDITAQRNIIIRDVTFTTLPRLNAAKKPCPDPDDPYTLAGNNITSGVSGCNKHISISGTEIDVTEAIPAGSVVPNGKNSENIWIDHNEFRMCGDKCINIKNGNSTNATGRWYGSDKVTISNNTFSDSFYAVLITIISEDALRGLIGHSTSQCEAMLARGELTTMRVSVYGNVFDTVRRRSVRAAYCTSMVHQFNNVHKNFAKPFALYSARFPKAKSCEDTPGFGWGPSSTYGAQLLLEGNYIAAWPDDPKGCKEAINISGSDDGEGRKGDADSMGYVKEQNNLYENGAIGTASSPSRVFTPPYSYTLIPTAEVHDTVMQHAGPRSENR